MTIEVILASQTHNVPQVGLPHNDPVIIAKQVNNRPIGAILLEIKFKFFILKRKVINDKNAIVIYAAKEIQADGT